MDLFDMQTMVTSTRLSPVQLLCLRAFLLAYALTALLATISTGTLFYGYFTNWTLLGINMYLMAAVFNTAYYIYSQDALAKMNSRPVVVRYINWMLYMVPAVSCYIVSIVYWSLIFPSSKEKNPFSMWVTASQHAANSIIMISELIFGCIPLAYAHLPTFLLIAFLYLGITLIFHAKTGIWAYNFLDTSKPGAWMYYLGVGVFFVIVFFGMTFLHNWRDARRERLGMVPRVAQFQDRDADNVVPDSTK
ncbi:hypothetical protein HDU77_009552 [Chytriomyces hyalinus]|nr:hypothetical protein HDU77_009552 [Chytriomyces hyalinus]